MADSAHDLNPLHGDDESAALAGYQSPSPAAVISLLLGLASPLAVFNELLLAIPLAGVAAAIFALRRIAASEGALIGRKAALVGLFLSVACGAGILTQRQVTRLVRVAQATETAKEWIALVLAGDTESAYWLSTGVPIPDPDRPEQFGPEGNPYLNFLKDPAIQALQALGPDAQVQLQETVAFGAQGGGEFYVRQKYVVAPPPTAAGADSSASPVHLLMQMHRTRTVGATYKTWRATVLPE